jgi:hypothetical protein
MERKYKVGDRVVIVGNRSGHEFKDGDVVTVCSVRDEFYDCTNGNGDMWFVKGCDVVPCHYQTDQYTRILEAIAGTDAVTMARNIMETLK